MSCVCCLRGVSHRYDSDGSAGHHTTHSATMSHGRHDPIPLTRAWCLWEILSTMRMEAELTVQMVPIEAASFTRALEEDFDKGCNGM